LASMQTGMWCRGASVQFRNIKVNNVQFMRSLGRHAGGIDSLLAVGFVERESLEEEADEPFLFMEEPSLEQDIDGWGRWFDGLKRCRDEVRESMDMFGITALPTAAKGLGWHESKERRSAEHSDCEVLHGQAGGGR